MLIPKAIAEGVRAGTVTTQYRRWKGMGLTISHEVGYELSPRGAAYLSWLHGLTVVTRNTKHFERTGVPLIDPWDFTG